jgi:hypothetical protein
LLWVARALKTKRTRPLTTPPTHVDAITMPQPIRAAPCSPTSTTSGSWTRSRRTCRGAFVWGGGNGLNGERDGGAAPPDRTHIHTRFFLLTCPCHSSTPLTSISRQRARLHARGRQRRAVPRQPRRPALARRRPRARPRH